MESAHWSLLAIVTGSSEPGVILPSTSATAAGCLAAGEPTAIAACTAAGFTISEVQKCIVSGGKDCFGPNNDLVKTVDRNIVGPVKDIITGNIGGRPKSVWRQLGLPHIRLW